MAVGTSMDAEVIGHARPGRTPVILAHPLRDLLAIANTRHGAEAVRPLAPSERVAARDGFDRLRDPNETARFLSALGVDVPAGPPAIEQILRLKLMREAVRALAEGDEVGYRGRLDRVTGGLTFVIESGELRPAANGWDGLIAGTALQLSDLHRYADRLKVCHNPRCGWVFVDRSRNRGSVWCEAQLCGDRVRSRRYRRRHRTRSAGESAAVSGPAAD